MTLNHATTVDGHYKAFRKGKLWYYGSTDKKHLNTPTGPFFSIDDALEAAQLFENEYRRHKVKK